jgi:RHS repeat-associated protein
VAGVSYNTKGHRTQIDYGNGASTNYEYDEKTFRLTRLHTVRASDAAQLQDLSYTYDPVGNITSIRDHAQQPVYFDNHVVTASAEYEYDAIYRLTEATGREHLGQTNNQLNASQQPTDDDGFRTNLPHPGDGAAMGNYAESYQYDEVGNILKMIHSVLSGGWTRNYQYDPGSNRLLLTSNPSGSLTDGYNHDVHGNMIKMPHLPLMQWDFKDQLHATSRQVVTNGTPETTWYVYDSSGQRVRKVTDNSAANGQTTRKSERIYLGGFEIYREYGSGGSNLTLERETLHIMDDKQRIALVETKTQDGSAFAGTLPDTLIRYQFSNHLGSSTLELDQQSKLISYEEYFPYGSSSYQAVRSQSEAPKRYRYTDRERDEESGLAYHSARYYAAWLIRWINCDPSDLADGTNLLSYGKCNPVRFSDESGHQSNDSNPPLKKELDFISKKEAAEKWSQLDLNEYGIQLDEVVISGENPVPPTPEQEPAYSGRQLREVEIIPSAVFVAFIGGAADKFPFLGQAPTNIMLDVRNEFVANLNVDTTNSNYFRANYYGYEDVQNGTIQRDIESALKTNPQQDIYVVGHSLGGWEGASLTSSYPAAMLITLDPVGTTMSYTGEVSFAEPNASADSWINILARTNKPDMSDFIAELGGRWHMDEGPSRRDTANLNHAAAADLMKFVPPAKDTSATAPRDSSAWELLTEKIRKNLSWRK